jgi:hypothetical protein
MSSRRMRTHAAENDRHGSVFRWVPPGRIIATDGAGNTAAQKWTVNVDPEGHISSAEVIATLEAADGMSESTAVASTTEVLEPEQIQYGEDPELKVNDITALGRLESHRQPRSPDMQGLFGVWDMGTAGFEPATSRV